MGIKLGSRTKERTDNGCSSSTVTLGTLAEIEALYASLLPGTVTDQGELSRVRIFQESPQIWGCEVSYASDVDGDETNKPNTVYGKKPPTRVKNA